MLIRQRCPKLQIERRLSILSQREEEAHRLAALRSYRGVHMSIDVSARRPMSTIVELSSDQVHTSSEDLHFTRELPTIPLTPLVHRNLTSVFSTIVAMSKKTKTNVVTFQEEEEKLLLTTENSFISEKSNPMQKYETGPVRSMADVDAELVLLQKRFDSLEQTIEDNIPIINNNHQYIKSIQLNDTNNNKTSFVLDKLVLTKEKLKKNLEFVFLIH